MSVVQQMVVQCDNRGCRSSVATRRSDRAGARERAEAAGWMKTGGKDWCPNCLGEGRKVQEHEERMDRVFGLKHQASDSQSA